LAKRFRDGLADGGKKYLPGPRLRRFSIVKNSAAGCRVERVRKKRFGAFWRAPWLLGRGDGSGRIHSDRGGPGTFWGSSGSTVQRRVSKPNAGALINGMVHSIIKMGLGANLTLFCSCGSPGVIGSQKKLFRPAHVRARKTTGRRLFLKCEINRLYLRGARGRCHFIRRRGGKISKKRRGVGGGGTDILRGEGWRPDFQRGAGTRKTGDVGNKQTKKISLHLRGRQCKRSI